MYKHSGHLLRHKNHLHLASEQAAKWRNDGHLETGEDTRELSDHSLGAQKGDNANAKAVLEESCKATAESQDLSQSLISALGSNSTWIRDGEE